MSIESQTYIEKLEGLFGRSHVLSLNLTDFFLYLAEQSFKVDRLLPLLLIDILRQYRVLILDHGAETRLFKCLQILLSLRNLIQ